MDELTLEKVLQFITSNGGRVQNSTLVKNFKDFLNHPVHKATNRQKFKDIINELAIMKLVEGDKVLVLKGKYLQPAVTQASVKALQDDSTSVNSETSSDTGSQMDVDSVDGGMVSKATIDEAMEVKTLRTDRVPLSVKEANVSNSTTSSTASLISTESHKSQASSTSGVSSMDEEANTSVNSVKDKIKQLNKDISDTDMLKIRPAGYNQGNKKVHKHIAGEDDSETYVTLDADQKDWLIVCASAEYHDMNKLLHRKPGLAKLKDLTNGYTALHWAAKSGKSEVIKMLASKPGVNVNHRSHGGFTALHLAAIHGHEEVMELLVQIYKADVNVRDYSGKKAKQYLRNNSSKISQLFMSRKLGSADSLTRSSMRKSTKGKGVPSLFLAMSNVVKQPMLTFALAPLDGPDEKDGHSEVTPNSEGSSPSSGHKILSDDALSEVAMRRPKNSPAGSKSSSRDASPSSKIGSNES